MTSVIKYTVITNPNAAVLTIAPADSGDNVALEPVKRVFRAEDVGTNVGQTRDGTDPTVGCLVAQFDGSRILDVLITPPYRAAVATNTTFQGPVTGVANNTSKVDYRVSYNPQTGISSVYIFDRAAAAPGQIVAGDWIYIKRFIGDSVTVPPQG